VPRPPFELDAADERVVEQLLEATVASLRGLMEQTEGGPWEALAVNVVDEIPNLTPFTVGLCSQAARRRALAETEPLRRAGYAWVSAEWGSAGELDVGLPEDLLEAEDELCARLGDQDEAEHAAAWFAEEACRRVMIDPPANVTAGFVAFPTDGGLSDAEIPAIARLAPPATLDLLRDQDLLGTFSGLDASADPEADDSHLAHDAEAEPLLRGPVRRTVKLRPLDAPAGLYADVRGIVELIVDRVDAAITARSGHDPNVPVGLAWLPPGEDGDVLPSEIKLTTDAQYELARAADPADRPGLTWSPDAWDVCETVGLPPYSDELDDLQGRLTFELLNLGLDWPPRWILQEVCRALTLGRPAGTSMTFIAFSTSEASEPGERIHDLLDTLEYVVPDDHRRILSGFGLLPKRPR
jgi:hypothetical protein